MGKIIFKKEKETLVIPEFLFSLASRLIPIKFVVHKNIKKVTFSKCNVKLLKRLTRQDPSTIFEVDHCKFTNINIKDGPYQFNIGAESKDRVLHIGGDYYDPSDIDIRFDDNIEKNGKVVLYSIFNNVTIKGKGNVTLRNALCNNKLDLNGCEINLDDNTFFPRAKSIYLENMDIKGQDTVIYAEQLKIKDSVFNSPRNIEISTFKNGNIENSKFCVSSFMTLSGYNGKIDLNKNKINCFYFNTTGNEMKLTNNEITSKIIRNQTKNTTYGNNTMTATNEIQTDPSTIYYPKKANQPVIVTDKTLTDKKMKAYLEFIRFLNAYNKTIQKQISEETKTIDAIRVEEIEQIKNNRLQQPIGTIKIKAKKR